MTVFRYRAFGADGQPVEGSIEADSLQAALAVLKQRGVSAYRADPVDGVARRWFARPIVGERMGLAERGQLMRRLAILLRAGIALDQALRLLSSQAMGRRERTMVTDILEKIVAGQSLTAALTARFQGVEIGLIKAGEQSGALVPVLEEVATLLERQTLLRTKLISALIYPAVLLTFAPASLLIVATVLVPNLVPLFETSGADMPPTLRALIWFSAQFTHHGVLWVGGALLFCLSIYLGLRHGVLRDWIDRLAQKMPLIGAFARHAEASRFCHALGSLLSGGVPLQSALAMVANVTRGQQARNALRRVQEAVAAGERLATGLTHLGFLDAPSLQMIAIGEDSNRLESMLHFVAESEERALATLIERFVTLFTPLMTIAMGLMVGGIVLSVMRAILAVSDVVAR